MFGDKTGLTVPEFLIFAVCMVGGGVIVAGVGLQWGVGAELIAVGAYTIISALAYFGIIERKKSIAEFEAKRKQSNERMDKVREEMDGLWRKK